MMLRPKRYVQGVAPFRIDPKNLTASLDVPPRTCTLEPKAITVTWSSLSASVTLIVGAGVLRSESGCQGVSDGLPVVAGDVGYGRGARGSWFVMLLYVVGH